MANWIEQITSQFNQGINRAPTTVGTPFVQDTKLLQTQIPLDFSAQTLAGAQLPSNVNKALNTKLDTSGMELASDKKKGSNWIGKGFDAAKFGKVADGVTTGLGLASGIAKPLDHVSGASTALDLAGNIAGNFGPYGKMVQAGLKLVTFGDQLTAKKANSQYTAGDTATGYDLAFNANAGTSYGGFFGNGKRKQANALSGQQDYANVQKIGASNIGRTDLMAATNSFTDTTQRNDWTRRGGANYNMLSASKGTKLNLSKIARSVAKKMEVKKAEEGAKMNVIPSGALHARKHDLPDNIADQITHKGIPVVTFEDNGKITQHAEVEREELTLHKELTVKLEDLFSQYKNANDQEKDKILIKTGKLITYEVLENTNDRTNLINKIE